MFRQVLLTFLIGGITGFFSIVNAQVFAANFPTQQSQSKSDQKSTLLLKDALRDIETRFGIHFVYKTDEIPNRSIPTETMSGKLEEVLESTLRPAGLTYKKVRNTYIIRSLKAKAPSSNPVPNETTPERLNITAPGNPANESASLNLILNRVAIPTGGLTAPLEIKIAGKVADESGLTLPGVSILLKGTNRGTTTDGNGSYQISVPDNNAILVFSYVGYLPQEIAVGNRTTIDVTLGADTKALSEVVVVGYGTQKRTSLTGAVAEVKSEQLTRRPVSNANQALQGIAPGVTILDRGGSPGPNSRATVRVRGITTLSSNDPLFIVDGIEQPFNTINLDDVESISVLKDASSTAIYGSRAANGVVLVTTKRAKSGKAVVDYSGYYAVQQAINKPEMMDLEPYMRLQNVAYINSGAAARFSEAQINEYVNATDRLKFPLPNTWFNTVLRSAPQMNHNLSVSGGNDVFRGRVGVRYQKQGGIAPNFDSDIREIRANTDFKISSRLNASMDINYRNNNWQTPVSEFNVFNTMFHGSLWAVPKYPNGTYGLSAQGNNPLMYAEIAGLSKNIQDYLFGSAKAEWEIIPNLKFSTQYAVRYTFEQNKNYTNAYTVTDYFNTSLVRKTIPRSSLTEIRSNIRETTLNNLLGYSNTFGQHDLKALVGYSEIQNKYNIINAYREDFYNNDVQSIGAGSDNNKNNGGSDSQWGLRSFFGRANYAFADKYLFEANARYDGSSRFTGDKVYSFFPSFSAGWRVSEEKFFDAFKNIISELKLRGSWGKTGNQAVGLYSYFQTLNSSTYTFGGSVVQGYVQSNLANPGLTWETTTQTDIGLDAQLWNNRLSFTFDYYDKLTDGILLNLPIPTTVGLNAPPQNAGKVGNKGIELGLNFRNKTKSGFAYDFGLNFAQNENKVIDLAKTGPYISGSDIDPRYIIKEGLPYNAHWGYKTDGLFQTTDEIKAYPTIVSNAKPGDVKYVDLNNDGKINSDDMTFIGLTFPRYTFGLNTNFSYKNFNLFTQWQGAADVDTRLSGALAEMGNYEGFTHKIYTDNYWTPENPSARFPRPVKLDLRNVSTSDRMIIDGSYFRLKTIQLSYSLPKGILEKVKANRATIYVSGTNLLTFSKLNEWNLDPEAESGRATYYPQTSLTTIGLNVQF
ncbi:SusC/RagA family TonB-linked outer membrane protein [Runella aurantiaca]|nr:TonB-dependent receptor [Runella aurantiaca]